MNYDFKSCTLCPRMCRRDRTVSKGYCEAGDKIKVARAGLHFWEEPCISGIDGDKLTPQRGSGTVFFSGCTLGCRFCQNHLISHERVGKEITVERLTEIFEELKENGAYNINLVSATPYIPQVIEALDGFSGGIPIVWNTGGYETVESLDMLKNYVDIWLPDLKFFDIGLSAKMCGAGDYFETAFAAIKRMAGFVGKPRFDDDEMMLSGVIVRHLVLPGHIEDSLELLTRLDRELSDDVLVSVMSQYTPMPAVANDDNLSRRLTQEEYDMVMETVDNLDLEGYFQELSSAQEEYVPDFDLTGV